MNKCRICLKYRQNLRSLYDVEDGIMFFDMISSFINLNRHNDNDLPNEICKSCRKRLGEAYNFKIDIERSEKILNESANSKRFHFNNINDIDIQIHLDHKPVMPVKHFSQDFFNNDTRLITYNDIIIKKTTEHNKDQIPVKLLNTVKVESDDDFNDENYELNVEYDRNSDSDFKYSEQINITKKHKIKGNTKIKKQMYNLLDEPIRPVYLKDVKIKHSDIASKHKGKPKKIYKYPVLTTVCPYCGKLLRSKSLETHILLHTDGKTFKCDQCSKIFLTKKILDNHKRNHIKDKTFKCSQCVASFVVKASLQSHMLVHTEEKKHICKICNKAFKRRQALYRHEMIHNFGKKPIQCELCPMTFYAKYFLRHHMRVHTGERPYKCEICSQPYSYKHDFNRHCLKKHGVFLKRRSVYVMNEEVLQQERSLMRDLTLRAHGVIKHDDIPSIFDGPQGALAFEQTMKAVQARQIPITYVITNHNN